MADAYTTTYTSGASTTRKPDVYDYMTNIDPDETVVTSALGRSKATSTKHQWPKDTLKKPSKNAHVEAAAIDAKVLSMPTMEDNYTQIMETPFAISDTQRAMKHYGMSSPEEYFTKRSLKEHALDLEWAVVNSTAKVAGDASTAREFVGLKGCITTNVYNFGGTYATTNLLTEEIFNLTMQKAWSKGGKPSLVLTPDSQKNTIDKFDGFNQLTKDIDAKAKTVVAATDYYNGSFASVRIQLHRFIEKDVDTSKNYDTIFMLEPGRFKLAPLTPVKTEKLARDRKADKFLISNEVTFEFLAEESSAQINHLYDPQQS